MSIFNKDTRKYGKMDTKKNLNRFVSIVDWTVRYPEKYLQKKKSKRNSSCVISWIITQIRADN